MSEELTDWFPGDVKPAREGVYEKDFGGAEREFQYWDGFRWHYGGLTPDETIDMVDRFVTQPSSRRWRGLAKEPK